MQKHLHKGVEIVIKHCQLIIKPFENVTEMTLHCLLSSSQDPLKCLIYSTCLLCVSIDFSAVVTLDLVPSTQGQTA